jgi:hypothetical protein
MLREHYVEKLHTILSHWVVTDDVNLLNVNLVMPEFIGKITSRLPDNALIKLTLEMPNMDQPLANKLFKEDASNITLLYRIKGSRYR